MKEKRVCRVAWCGRTTPKGGGSFCARCTRLIHPATWLQINDMNVEYVRARGAGEDLQLFIAYAWRVAIAHACDEALAESNRRMNPDYEPWSRSPDSPWRHDPEKVQ